MYEISSILLMPFSIFAYYRLGIFFGSRGVFTASLVGACIPAFIVAILSNFIAALIAPTIIFATLISGAFTLLYIYKSKKECALKNYKKIIFLVLLIGLLFYVNIPEKVFLRTIDNSLFLSFNPHYSYFSSQSFEMINADYLSRLRIANQYPEEWSGYHFFSSAYLALIRIFYSDPKILMAYFYAQLVLFLFVVCSLYENFLYINDAKKLSSIRFGIWLCIGFGLFNGAFSWMFFSNSIISFWGTVLFIWACYKNKLSEIWLSLLILSASSTRFLPLTIPLIALCTYLSVRGRLLPAVDIKRLVFVTSLLLIYVGISISFKPPIFMKFFSSNLLNPVWHHLLFLYRSYGEAQFIFNLKPLPAYDIAGDYFQFFSKINSIIGISYLYLLSYLCVIGLGFLIFIKKFPKKYVLLIALFFNIPFFASIFLISPLETGIYSFFFVLLYPYTMALLFLLYLSRFRLNTIGIIILLIFWLFGNLLLLTGTNEIKGPVTYSLYDTSLWALIGLIIVRLKIIKYPIIVTIGVILLFPPKFSSIFKMSDLDWIRVDHLTSAQDKLPNELDALSSYYGSRVYKNKATENFITNDFIPSR